MNVYDEFSQLKKAIVGKTFCLDDEIFNKKIISKYNNKISNKNISEKEKLKLKFNCGKNTFLNIFCAFKALSEKQLFSLKEIHDLTNKDLENLANILKSHDVEVVRPEINYQIEQSFSHPMQPRDTIGKIGSTIFEVFTNDNYRLLENTCYRNIILEEFNSGANLISSPFFYTKDEIKSVDEDDYDLKNELANKKIDSSNEIILEAAVLYKCGKHIFHSSTKSFGYKEHSKKCINKNGLNWIKKQFPDYTFLPINGHGHIDGKFSILKPGLVLTWDKKYIPEIILKNNWDIIMIEDRPRYKGCKIEDFLKEAGITKYPFSHLLGVCHETRFDANCLSINEQTVITAGYDKSLATKLKKYNIDMIPWFNQWNCLWSGGPHCCTLDLHRANSLENYFK
jgi:glycine amidinotransferase